jgi:hypothetical protein
VVCPYLTGLWTFRCLARDDFVIPSITEETRYCLGKDFERCPHYPRRDRRTKQAGSSGKKTRKGPDVKKTTQP